MEEERDTRLEEIEKKLLNRVKDGEKHQRITRILFYLFIITFAVTATTFSLYKISTIGTDTVRVASYVFNCMGVNDTTVTLQESHWQPGMTKDFSIIVNNMQNNRTCEVAQNYRIKLSTTNNLPLIYTLTMTDNIGNGTPVTINSAPVSFNNGEAEFLSGLFSASRINEHRYNLNISWPAEANNIEYMYEIDSISLTVRSEQKLN